VLRHSALGAVVAVALAGCGLHREPVVAPPGVQGERALLLNAHVLRLHFADLRQPSAGVRPLVVYATGDRGWAGKDLDVYRHLVAWDYPSAGFDAHDYVTHLGRSGATTPGGVAADYETIVRAARDGLGLDANVPVILLGVSRGADLSVVAAGQRPLRRQLTGVIAVGLTREEEYVKWLGRRARRAAASQDGPPQPSMVQLYDYLPFLRTLPITVIQSTHDNYLPAAQARVLFGTETPTRHFVAIDATNHSFGGARAKLYAAIQAALGRLAGSMRQ
jgi:hypothetical protein